MKIQNPYIKFKILCSAFCFSALLLHSNSDAETSGTYQNQTADLHDFPASNNFSASKGSCKTPKQGPPGIAGLKGPTGPTGPAGIFPIAFGELYATGPTTLSVPSGGGAFDLSAFDTAGINFNTVPSPSSDIITINITGNYLISFSLSYTANNNIDWTFAVAVNGVPKTNIKAISSSTGSSIIEASSNGLLALNAGDVVSVVYYKSTDPTTALTVAGANLNLVQIQ